MSFGTKGMAGLALMIVGVLLFGVAVLPVAESIALLALVPATLLLVSGTWMVGTSVEGQVV